MAPFGNPQPVRDATPAVSVLLGTWNRLDFLKQAVESIRASVGIYTYEIVVTDGGSTDGSREWLAAQPDVVLVAVHELCGAVRAFNQAWAVSKGRYVANFNDDAVYVDAALEHALDTLEHPDAAGVGQAALAFDTRGGRYIVEGVFGVPYANYGVARRHVVEKVAAAQGGSGHFWNPCYKTYAADSEFSLWVWKLGYEVAPLQTARVHDLFADDALRARNHEAVNEPAGKHPDTALFQERWAKAAPTPITPPSFPPGCRIHLGCGTKRLEGWINLDGLPTPAADGILDLYDLDKVPDAVASEVYWCHGPEHVFSDKLLWVFEQIHRILRPNGVFRVATVDLPKVFFNRIQSDADGTDFNAALYAEAASTDHPFLAHRIGFTEATLQHAVQRAGFYVWKHWDVEEVPAIEALNDFASCRKITLNLVFWQ